MRTDLSASSAARDLRTQLNPDRVLESGLSYDEARRIWNCAVEHRPALIVRCETATEAYRRVYPNAKGYNCASAGATNLMRKPHVRARIKEMRMDIGKGA